MHINVLSELTPLNEPWKAERHDKELARLFVINSNASQGDAIVRFYVLVCFFNVDHHDVTIGHTVLMLTKGSSTSSIHYLNSNGHLFQIADNLATYIRLMVLYLGLPDWPLVHLNTDLSYWNKVLIPHRIKINAKCNEFCN